MRVAIWIHRTTSDSHLPGKLIPFQMFPLGIDGNAFRGIPPISEVGQQQLFEDLKN